MCSCVNGTLVEPQEGKYLQPVTVVVGHTEQGWVGIKRDHGPQLARFEPREIRNFCAPRHCEERSDEAIQSRAA